MLVFSLFSLFCLEYNYFFNKLNTNKLTIKQKAYILSIKSSITMFIIGLYANFIYEDKVFDNYFAKLSVIYFSSYLFMDCYIGYHNYHIYMKSLSGYPHHIIYLFICIYSVVSHNEYILLKYMLGELPTIILGLGSFDKYYRNDNLFGITFFITRIVYHSYLGFFEKEFIIVFFVLLSLSVHIYWFSNWCKKYYLTPKLKLM